MRYVIRPAAQPELVLDRHFCIYVETVDRNTFESAEEAQRYAEGNAPQEVPFIVAPLPESLVPRHADAKALARAVSMARSDCLDALRRDRDTRRLWLVSRGAWVRTIGPDGNASNESDTWEFKPTAACYAEIMALRTDPAVTAVYIEGGFNGAETGQDYADGAYDPWVGEWSVACWVRD